MAIEVKIPAVGESITSGVVSAWHKKSGEFVNAEAAIVTAQDFVDFRCIPGLVAELEDITMSARKTAQKFIQALDIHFPTGRKLK